MTNLDLKPKNTVIIPKKAIFFYFFLYHYCLRIGSSWFVSVDAVLFDVIDDIRRYQVVNGVEFMAADFT